MASDYTVIQAVRQRFGSSGGTPGESAVFSNSPFVGRSKEYNFDCPGLDPSPMAVLQFATVGVDLPSYPELDRIESVIRINGVDIPGGLQPGDTGRRTDDTFYPTWKTQILLVPAHTLRSSNNVLFIEAAEFRVLTGFWVDTFVIDNIVLFYKTAASRPPIGGLPQSRG
jgi:hypothetical protein